MIWKHRRSRVWLIVAASVLTVVIAASIVATQHPFLRGTMNILFGGDRAITAGDRGYYEADYKNKAEVLAAANDFNIQLAEEGVTLLKNEGNALPLGAGAKISVFGKNSVNLVYGGSGSGGGNSKADKKNLYDSLAASGFSANPALKSFYENNARSGAGRPGNPGIGDIIAGFGTGETQMNAYTAAETGSYADYKDAALVVFSRIGGEGFDLPRTMKASYASGAAAVSGARGAGDHYLELDGNEADLLKHVCDNFSKVIVILNANHTMELGFLDDPAYWTGVLGLPDCSAKIQGALWIGSPGEYGIMALGKVLSGEVNPSGHTVDTYARDFTRDPSYNNFGNYNAADGNAYLVGGSLPSAVANRYYYIDYEEGIYVGYRYYETRAFTDGAAWYRNNVAYPFGFGLSYSEFEWEAGGARLIDGDRSGALPSALAASDSAKSVSVEVTVKNKSARAGKDVVQLYVQTPYTPGGIEKPHVKLLDFGKTKLLAPGASEKLTLAYSLYDLASYDYGDANGNGFKGFEAEAGEYTLHISRNAHSWADGDAALTRTFSVPETQSGASKGGTGFQYRDDPATGTPVTNRYDDVSAKIAEYLSRNDWGGTWPAAPTDTERTVTQEFAASLAYKKDDAGKPWHTDEMPYQNAAEIGASEVTVKLDDLAGKDYGDPLWDEFLDQLTLKQMSDLIGRGSYGTVQIENVGKPLTREPDGPSGFTNFMGDPSVYDTCFYVSECVVGATWNKALAFEMGKMVGNEGMIGFEKGDGLPYSGWYAPAVNIHRSQFSGRNWEYYSEDSALSGKMAEQVCLGAKEKGVYTFVKHFALNDLETSRDSNGILVWANEQAMREFYFKPFEAAVKNGKTTAMMSSFNRIGTVWAGGDYNLLTGILRDEWGFKGMVVTDYALSGYMNVEQMIRAGGDLCLTQGLKFPNAQGVDATQAAAIRKAAKNILYTVVNSNAMNAEILGYRKPVWVVALICADAAIAVGFGAWGFFAVRGAYRKERNGAGANGGKRKPEKNG
ncbi:MAG: glycoside hydrolase family 3 C-terminal domain-containing protein [Clostridiales bacterium]|nr:glycoside hydrolase family 3 C-terminal domain-containing protein [Clostridiales bacterium]